MIIEPLFPTAIGFSSVGRDFTEEELAFVDATELATYPNLGNLTSLNTHILNTPEMAALKEICLNAVKEYVQTVYQPKYEVMPYITQSWMNYTNKNGWHHKHDHSNSFISGVLYIKADKSQDTVKFFKREYQQIKLHTENYNVFNSDSWFYNVGAKDIILFPSHLSHEVGVVTADETRVSLAFNTFVKGYIGDETSLTRLDKE